MTEKLSWLIKCTNEYCKIKPSFTFTPEKDYYSDESREFYCSYCNYAMPRELQIERPEEKKELWEVLKDKANYAGCEKEGHTDQHWKVQAQVALQWVLEQVDVKELVEYLDKQMLGVKPSLLNFAMVLKDYLRSKWGMDK